MKKRILLILCVMNIFCISVKASTIEEESNKIKTLENKKIEILDEQNKINQELILFISENEILNKEIEEKENEINNIQIKLKEKEELKENQYELMKERIRYIYENKTNNEIFEFIVNSENFYSFLNKYDYINKLYEYDRNMIEEYQNTIKEIEELNNNLLIEKSKLQEMIEENNLNQIELKSKVEELNISLEEYNKQIENSKKIIEIIEQQNSIIEKEIENKNKEEKKEENNNLNNNNKTEINDSNLNSNNTSTSGQAVIDYALQFVGNPYVWGGTSLTNGADCSGFIMSVYKHFGVSLPHSSASMRSCGVGVSYSDAQPGDIICYSGHVALYMGNGKIVHASDEKTGIIVSNNAAYRTILTVRRVI